MGKNTGKLIILTLAQEPGLNAKQIYARTLREGKLLTYQGIHKKIRQLETEGILSRQGRAYFLDQTWLQEVSSLLEQARNHAFTQTEEIPIRALRTYYENRSVSIPKSEPF
jgi:predicted transcriptional regulator